MIHLRRRAGAISGLVGACDPVPAATTRAMRFCDPDRPPVAFAIPDDALTYRLGVHTGGELDTIEVCRR